MDLNFNYFRGCTNVINPNIRTVEVIGNIRRIRSQWAPELPQDIEVYDNIIAQEELYRILLQEINRAIADSLLFSFDHHIGAQTIDRDVVVLQPMELPMEIFFDSSYWYGDKTIIGEFKYFRGLNNG